MGEFEKDIRDLFEDAEFQPSDQVWSGIEGKLKSNKKKGLVFYWQHYGIAAAVVLILSVGYLMRGQLFDRSNEAAQTKEITEENQKPASEADATEGESGTTEKENPIQTLDTKVNEQTLADIPENVDRSKSGVKPFDPQPQASMINSKTVLITSKDEPQAADLDFDRGFEMSLLALPDRKSVAYQLQWYNKYLVPAPDFGNDTLPYYAPESRDISVLAALGSGSFSTDFGTPNTQFEAINSLVDNGALQGVVDVVSNAENQQENSFTVGGGISLDLRGQWGFRTGLSFAQYRFSNISNAYSEEGGKQLPIYIPAGFDDSSVFIVGTYGITSTLSTISVPASFSYRLLQAGRFRTSFNAGLGIEYIMAYNIRGDLNFLESRKVNFLENKLFNRWNLTGLTGLEFGYKLNESFGLNAEMFLRKYLFNADASDGIRTSPAFYGFGLSVNYFLRP